MSSPIITTVKLSNSSLNVTLSIGDINSNTVIEFNNSNLSVNISFGGGTYRHNELTDESKSLPNQHPASSITYGDGTVEEILNGRFLDVDEGNNINIDKTDPQRPIINVDETPTFTDTLITGLKSDAGAGGEVPATLYNWFKSVYASLVDISVKSWIIGIVTYLKSITDRVGVLENNIIAEYTFPADSTGSPFTLAGFEILPNQPFRIIIEFPEISTDDRVYTWYVRLNEIQTSNYFAANTVSSVFSLGAGAMFTKTVFDFCLANGTLSGFTHSQIRRTGAISGTSGTAYIIGSTIQSIVSISIIRYTTPKIPAGSTIKIYRL